MIAGVALGLLLWSIIISVAWWGAFGFFPWAGFFVGVCFGLLILVMAIL